ncbi:hypothetical protein [Streptomyces sp. NPDC047869]|uniref:hypothetical protein n=1 Tax=Streptomyces sp. NPDC047869 TaxID=3154709 RepID=UPI0034522A1E
MNGFQDRREVHQVVFRWDGNHGRQGTGMSAVAHSCPPERAERLGQELGRLLWVSGAAAARRSVVRTVSRDGDVMLVQRWPTTDRGGRPSTVSHVLFGDPRALKTRQCLGLAHRGWGSQEKAEQAKGPQSVIDCAELDEPARRRLPGMLDALPSVEHALILATAELLRDPAQRVSLLLEEGTARAWPDADRVPLVYLGLFLIFGSWLGQEWTFATYDTVDTHPLRLMAVPRWEPDAGGSGPLARIMDRRPARPGLEHRAASRLVKHLLANPEAPAGVPQLVDGLADGAALDWERRSARLRAILGTDRPPARTRYQPEPLPVRDPEPLPVRDPEPLPVRDPDPVQVREPDPVREPAPPREPAPLRGPEPRPARPPESAPRSVHAPEPVSPHRRPQAPDPAPAPVPEFPHSPEPDFAPAPPPGASTEYGTGGHPVLSLPDGFDTAPAAAAAALPGAPDSRALHRELCGYRRGDAMGHRILVAELGRQSDEVLLDELSSEQLSPDAIDLVLDELGGAARLQQRRPETRHALCAEVLKQNLYFAPRSSGTEPTLSRTATAERAVRVFQWAVAPLVRDERYLRDLRELFYGMSRDRHATTGNWLWQTFVEPENGPAPDLPPVLWSQLLRDAYRGGAVSAVPSPPPTVQRPTAQPVHRTPSSPPGSPESPAGAGPPSSARARFGELTSNPGCVIGGFVGVIAVMIALVLILV